MFHERVFHKLVVVFILTVVLLQSETYSAGFAENENFVVLSPAVPSQAAGQRFAEKLAKQANELRVSISKEWFGTSLPDGIGRTIINVQFSKEPDSALTWAKDSEARKFHNIYLKTPKSANVALGLAHEVAHTVLATEFPHPNPLPPWMEEAIASRYDEKSRIKKREQVIDWYARSNNWPRIESVLTAKSISPRDAKSYSVACSVTDYLLVRGKKADFIALGRSIRKGGLENALRQVYGIQDVAELELLWQKWVIDARTKLSSRATASAQLAKASRSR